jgi:hypothetical protein
VIGFMSQSSSSVNVSDSLFQRISNKTVTPEDVKKVLYIFKQVLSFAIGFALGIIPIQGFYGFLIFIQLSLTGIYIFQKYLKLDPEDNEDYSFLSLISAGMFYSLK